MKLNELNAYLSQIMQPGRFTDYCPNGLQIEGKLDIHKIVTGVTASYDLIQAAIESKADAILVHHGYFWRGESQVLTGSKKRRIQTLLEHDISLFAYHLPLDAHPVYGNNVMLGQQLGLDITRWLDDKGMLACSELAHPMTLEALIEQVKLALNRSTQTIGDPSRLVKTVAWCTGAAQGYIDQAIAAEVDVYISGEISEQTVHAVRESNTAYIAAGHHATERYGVKALGEHLAQMFSISHEFIDIDNPV
ncbi:MAG: Nif3-like dinuclear metal center hexameric protein [Methylophilus sp.]|nr:Nif3-like dinuclear metal center hexameric protein [Methylophilus sp.]